jgi:hypothetical protein
MGGCDGDVTVESDGAGGGDTIRAGGGGTALIDVGAGGVAFLVATGTEPLPPLSAFIWRGPALSCVSSRSRKDPISTATTNHSAAAIKSLVISASPAWGVAQHCGYRLRSSDSLAMFTKSTVTQVTCQRCELS